MRKGERDQRSDDEEEGRQKLRRLYRLEGRDADNGIPISI